MKTIKYLFLIFILASCTGGTGSSVNPGQTSTGESSTGGQLGGAPPSTRPVGGNDQVSCTGEADMDGYCDLCNENGTGTFNSLRSQTVTLSGIAGQGGNDVMYRPGVHPLKIHEIETGQNQGKYADPQDLDSNGNPILKRLDFYNDSMEKAYQSLKNDGTTYVRIKVMPQVFPADDNHHCYDRNVDAHKSEFPYTKLRFRIHRYLMVFNPESELWEQKKSQFVETTDPIEVGDCGSLVKIFQFSPDEEDREKRHFTMFSIDDVRSDLRCQQGGEGEHYCPAEFNVKRSDCWSIILQVATDSTHFFKGLSRN